MRLSRSHRLIYIVLLCFESVRPTMATLPVEKKKFFVPSREEIATVLAESLVENFDEVRVDVVDCPDLTQAPFTLANPGLSGKTRLVEVGGPPYLLPLADRTKIYDLLDIAEISGSKKSATFLLGAGAGPHLHAGANCEGIINVSVVNGSIVEQGTRIARINKATGSYVQEVLPQSESRIALLGNLFVCEGKPGPVIRVHARKRTGKDDFVASIRKALEKHYGDKILGLGGAFLLKEGKAKQHVMPDFSAVPLDTDDDVNGWLKFFEMSAPLVALGTLVTGEYELDLRVQHFHSFSHHGDAGHYHIDTTPDSVEYLGYFNTAEFIYRVDKPISTHKVGRD